MFLKPFEIDRSSVVKDIVSRDYRTAEIFRKYDIEFCCGGNWELGAICDMKGLDMGEIKKEIETAIRTFCIHPSVRFNEWSIDFLTEYIVNIHHHYLKTQFPRIGDHLQHFTDGHRRKYPYLPEANQQYNYLVKSLLPHLHQEEEILFPYIRQIAHAYESRETYASLLVRTLRKPVEDVMHNEHVVVSKVLKCLRELTNNYSPPEDACVSHKVTFNLLKELDNDLAQHLYLENEILFPKAIAMEKELLQRP